MAMLVITRGFWLYIKDPNTKVSGGDEHPCDEPTCSHRREYTEISGFELGYPLVNYYNYGKSQFLMGKSTINGHFQ